MLTRRTTLLDPASDAAPCSQGRGRSVPIAAVVIGCCVLLASHRANAFKWHSCPTPPLPVYPSALGATNAPFIHPGHELTIVLNQDEVALTGGFSIEPDGNQIFVNFPSLFGAPIPLSPRTATAASSAVLTFSFPDTASALDVGRVLAGPVAIQVVANAHVVADINATDLVALPPATDVTELVLGTDPEQSVAAALGADGDLWIPASFHGDPMPTMPGCIGTFIIPVALHIGGATVEGDVPTNFDGLDRIRKIAGYLGDIVVNDFNFYGMLYPLRIDLVHQDGTLGVSICRRNDAIDLVLRLQGDQSWARSPASPFRQVAADSTPLSLHLTAAPLCPGLEERSDNGDTERTEHAQSDSTPHDSFGNDCPSPGQK